VSATDAYEGDATSGDETTNESDWCAQPVGDLFNGQQWLLIGGCQRARNCHLNLPS